MNKWLAKIQFFFRLSLVIGCCSSCTTEESIVDIKLTTIGGDVFFSMPKKEARYTTRTGSFLAFEHVIKSLDCNDDIKDVNIYIHITAVNNYTYILQGRRQVENHDKSKKTAYGLDYYGDLPYQPSDYLLASDTDTYIYCIKNKNCKFEGSFRQYIDYGIFFHEKFLVCWPKIENSSLQVINNYYKKNK